MKSMLIILISICMVDIGVFGQSVTNFHVADTSIVRSSEESFIGLELKDSLSNGLYIGYYDTAMTKIALVGYIKEYKVIGSLQEWDYDGLLLLNCGFLDGLRHGLCMEAMKIEGRYNVNIMWWEKGVLSDIIQMEW